MPRAIYLELETYLENLDFNAQTAKMSRKKSQADRENRMQKVLDGSRSAEEALLKCCAHFNLAGDSSTVLSTLEDIVQHRRKEMTDLEETMIASVAAAIRQQNRIEKEQPGWIALKKQEKGEILNPLPRYFDQVKNLKSVPQGADTSIEERVKELVSTAKTNASKKPDEVDLVFAEVNADQTGNESENEEGDDTGESSSAKKKRKLAAGKKEKANKDKDDIAAKEKLFKMKKALRDHVTEVQGYGKELCGRVRSLRYIEQIRRLQQDGCLVECPGCGKSGTVVDTALLSSCGHVGCLNCVRKHASKGVCVQSPSCAARISGAHVVPGTYLGTAKGDNGDAREGSKLTEVIRKVREIIKGGDRMILFVQFDDLKERIAQTLKSHGIQAVQVKGRVEDQVKALLPFQEENPKKGDPRVLLLKMDDEQSAGLNLTQLNHVLFVHPLLANSQQEYDAYETQAIGRVRRFGQRKTVFVWRFLVKDSIDTAIFEARGGRSLSATTSGGSS